MFDRNTPLFVKVPDVMPPDRTRIPPGETGIIKRWHVDGPLRPICFVVGVDLGQSRDFTAIAVNEINFAARVHYSQSEFEYIPAEMKTEQLIHHRIRHLERVPLGTSYVDIVFRVKSLLERLYPLPRKPELCLDGTGVGRAVCDMFRAAGMDPLSITITAGDGITIDRRSARVAKKILASEVAVALDNERLQVVASGPTVEVLRNELRSFKVKITSSANATFEAWREADHDDVLLATALSCWLGNRTKERLAINPAWSRFDN
jgi:hypothetical protein